MEYLKKEKIESMAEKEKEELAIDLIQGINQRDSEECINLAWIFFLNYHNTTSVFKKIKPETYEINKPLRKSLIDSTISKCFKVWFRTDFFNIKSIPQGKKRKSGLDKKPLNLYRFNLNPLFIFCERWNLKFNEIDKRIMELLFAPDDIRKSLRKEYWFIDFIEAILKYYLRFYIYHLKNPIKIKKDHFFKKEELDYYLYTKYRKPSSRINKYGDRVFRVKKSDGLDYVDTDFHNKFEYYCDPKSYLKKSHIVDIKPKFSKRRLSNVKSMFPKEHYSIYESLQIFYPDIMREIDSKIISVLLTGFAKKNN